MRYSDMEVITHWGNPHVCTDEPAYFHSAGACGCCTKVSADVTCDKCLEIMKREPESDTDKLISDFVDKAIKI